VLSRAGKDCVRVSTARFNVYVSVLACAPPAYDLKALAYDAGFVIGLIHGTAERLAGAEPIEPPAPSEPPAPACSDGVDNDGDILYDQFDPGCSSPSDTDEDTSQYQCDDGLDNDADGKTDYANEPDCSTVFGTSETGFAPPPPPPGSCDPSYPGVCIPPPPPDLDCGDISYTNFAVLPPDPHGFDGDNDGVGCET
jgi:hypothetical protein